MLPRNSWKYGKRYLEGLKKDVDNKINLASSEKVPRLLQQVMATRTPSNSLVLKCAKRLRTEVRNICGVKRTDKPLFGLPAFHAPRDNLSLYSRLVRLQNAAYHATRSTSNNTPNMNEEFTFKPPQVPPAGNEGLNHQNAANSSAQASSQASSSHSVPPYSSGPHSPPPPPPGPPGWQFYQFYAPQPPQYYQQGAGGSQSNFNFNGTSGLNPTNKNPLPIYIVPNKWNWINFGLSAVFVLVLIYFWSSSGSSGGPLGSLMSNRFEIATPNPDLSFDDVKGNAEAKEELFDVVEYLKDPESFAKLGIKIPKGILLTGPPGTGKTMLARAVAAESGVPFISTSGAEFEEMLVGVGARRVRQLFEIAKKNAPCIVFIDEIDAVGSKRDDMNNSHHRMSINQLLVEMDGFNPSQGIIVIGATNLSHVLDPALIRPGRFDRKVSMELPDPKARKEILDHYLKDKQVASDVQTNILARVTAGFSGADMETMVNWAAIIASKQKSAVLTMKMLEEAMFNVAMGRERRSLALNEATRQLTAYHEGGHALVSLKTPGSLDIRRATLVPRGEALGMVNYLDKEEEPFITQQELLARMDTAMGGRAAEEIIYGTSKITQGAGSDFESATRVATAMVTKLGMSPRLGPVSISTDKDSRISPETLLIVEEETRRLLNESYERAKNILKENENELHLLANALLKYESLTVDEIKRAITGDPLLDKQEEINQAAELTKRLEEERANARQQRKAAAAAEKEARKRKNPKDSTQEKKVEVNIATAKEE